MNRIVVTFAALAIAVSLPIVTGVPGVVSSDSDDSDDSDSDDLLFEIENFVGVSGPFLGAANNPIRGVNGAGAPWVLDEIEAELMADGTFTVEVEGLVLTRTGVNPSPTFGAILSCLVGTSATDVKLTTGRFPATPDGDALIRATFTLPSICVAPIVFVTSSTGAWFAASGF